METKLSVITRDVEVNKFWKRTFSNEKDAIEFKNIVENGYCVKQEFVGLIKEKKVGHRWCLCIRNSKEGWKQDMMFFNSKKSCILAGKLIKEYNSDLITYYIKNY